MDEETVKKYRVVCLGAAAVGKTNIISQFIYANFMPEYKETIEEMHLAEYNFDCTKLIMEILDTSGSYSFPAMRNLAISAADAIALIFAVDNQSSFEQLTYFRDDILKVRNDGVPIIVVGNKCDIRPPDRVVSRVTAETMVCSEWNCSYIETSAKDDINILGCFQELLRLMKFPHPLRPAVERRRLSSYGPPKRKIDKRYSLW